MSFDNGGSEPAKVSGPVSTQYASFKEAAVACRARHKDRADAAKELAAIVRSDHRLLLEVAEDFLDTVCATAMRTIDQHENRQITNAAARSEYREQIAGSSRRFAAVAAQEVKTLLNYVLPDGRTELGDANQKILFESADYHKRRGKSHTAMGNWFALIANNLPKGKIVRQAFKERELLHMSKKTGANPYA